VLRVFAGGEQESATVPIALCARFRAMPGTGQTYRRRLRKVNMGLLRQWSN
jgi:hypothetical protein